MAEIHVPNTSRIPTEIQDPGNLGRVVPKLPYTTSAEPPRSQATDAAAIFLMLAWAVSTLNLHKFCSTTLGEIINLATNSLYFFPRR